MGLSERTINKLMAESGESGSPVYKDGQEPLEDDVTHFDEDDDPLTLVGDLDADGDVDEDDRAIGEVPDDGEENS